jgi:predicted nuclease of restriction endonuclease-like RecB superfamily
VAASFAVTAVELEAALFADLLSERRVAELSPSLSASRIATDANLAIVSSLIRRAAHVRIAVHGNARPLVRHARALGLICCESRLARGVDGVVLDVSGPFALFHHSEIYGRALASLIVRLRNCDEFELTATCSLGSAGHLPSLVVRSGDPIGSGSDSVPSESRTKQKFARDFLRAAPDWELIGDPDAIAVGGTLIFPDFEITPRDDPSGRWLLELVGFWTPEYLHEKLERLRASGIERFLLCVDQKRECSGAELPSDPRIIRFKTRVDPRAVLAIVNAKCAAPKAADSPLGRG